MKLNGLLSRDRICELLSYDSETGTFMRLKGRSDRIGTEPGTMDSKGGRQIRVDGRLYLAHRLAWVIMTGEWPAMDVDHKDGNPSNNAWTNLRLATDSQNLANSKKPKNNTSGFKGAYFERATGRWNSYIGDDHQYLGTFDTAEEAGAAYLNAAKMRYGEFARAA